MPSMTSSERQLEEELISKLKELKYAHRDDIRDRATLIVPGHGPMFPAK